MNKKIALIAIVALLVAGIFVYSANTSKNGITTSEVNVPVDGYTVDETILENSAVEGLPEEGLPEDVVVDTTVTEEYTAPIDGTGTTQEETTVEETVILEETAPDTTNLPESTYPIYKHVYGNQDAPVTIIEYASMSCGHCAKFHQDFFADVKAKILDTGKAKLHFVDYPLNSPAFKATKLTQCIGTQNPARYEGILQTLFNNQAQWATSSDVDGALLQYGRLAGLSEDQFNACQNDTDLENALLKQVQEAQVKYQIDSTPSFVLLYNGKVKKISGTQNADAFAKAIEEIKK